MDSEITIRRLVATFMIVGLALAPLARPAMAGSVSVGAMPDALVATSAEAMADEMANDMPCCPSKAPMPSDCDKCLLMAVCMNASFAAVPAFTVLRFPAMSGRMSRPKDDSWLESLAHPPPDHPPRILT